jgi:hypothetical protein
MSLLRRFSLLSCACAALFIVVACGKKSDPAAEARLFFERIAAGQTKEAYESAAFAFKAQQSQKAFEATVREQGMAPFAQATWQAAQMEADTAKVRADLTEKSGATAAIIVTLVEESGAWRVFSIHRPKGSGEGANAAGNLFGSIGKVSGFKEAIDRPLPDPKGVEALVRESLMTFNDAVQEKSFDDFFDTTAKRWQHQLANPDKVERDPEAAAQRPLRPGEKSVGAARLQRAFQNFMDADVNLAGIKDVPVALDAPAIINSDGLLVVAGHFPTTPFRVVFSLRYIYEVTKWKLFGIDVNLVKAGK